MAWGKSKPEVRPSAFSTLLPLILALLVVGGVAFVVYQIWLTSKKIEKQAADRMAKKNVVWTKEGMRVGVKHYEEEKYVDKTQSWIVKAWNLGSALPAAATGKKKK